LIWSFQPALTEAGGIAVCRLSVACSVDRVPPLPFASYPAAAIV
jgi:hypothetical protein